MRKIIALCLVISAFLTSVDCYAESEWDNYPVADGEITMGQPDTTDWYEQHWPVPEKAFGTVIDVSFLLEEEAGSHGFVTVDDNGIMTFEDGTEAKFWGAAIGNNIMQASATREYIDNLVQRIALSGYNIVRFHAYDNGLANNYYGTRNVKTTKEIDPAQLDKFHYMVAKFKEYGVYSYIDILTYRQIAEGDRMSPYERSVQYYSDEFIEYVCNSIKILFEPVNPYTGLSLAHDPAVLGISLNNETSIFYELVGSKAKTYWHTELSSKFNKWLAEKYGNRENLAKAWAQEGRKGLMSDEDPLKGTVVYDAEIARLAQDLDDVMALTALSKDAVAVNKGWSNARIEDIYKFLYDMQLNSYNIMRDFLRNELGYKNIINGVSHSSGLGVQAYMCMQESTGTSAVNLYKSHPNVSMHRITSSELTPWITSLVRNGQELYVTHPGLPMNSPVFNTETGIVTPGPHVPEMWVQLAINSRTYNLHPFVYTYGPVQGTCDVPGEVNVQVDKRDYFSTEDSAMMQNVVPLIALMYKRDNSDMDNPENVVTRPYSKETLFVRDNENLNASRVRGPFCAPTNVFGYGRIGVVFTDQGDSVNEESMASYDNMYDAFRNNTPQSKQLYWNQDTGLMRWHSDYTSVACGYIGGLTLDLPHATFEINNQSGVAGITSATMDKFEETDRWLLSLVGRSLFKGEKYDRETGHKKVTVGEPVQVVEPVTGTVIVKIKDDIKIYALDSSGQRTAEVPFVVTEEGYKKVTITKDYKASNYEIIKSTVGEG